jgi:hypothetical protein
VSTMTENPYLANPTRENLESERRFEIEFLANIHNWNEVFSKPRLSYREVILWAVFRSWSDVASHRWLSNSVPGGAENFITALFNRLPQLIDQVQKSWVTIRLNPQSAHGRLMGALRAGEVQATGLRAGELERRAVLADQWEDLQITNFPGVSTTVPDDRACLDVAPVWSRLKFERSDVERIFPPIVPDGVEVEIVDAGEGEDAPGPVVEAAKAKGYRSSNAKDLKDLKALYKSGFDRDKAFIWGRERHLSRQTVYELIAKVPEEFKKMSGGRKRPPATA